MNKKYAGIFAIISLISLNIHAQGTKPLFTLDGEPYHVKEFKHYFLKNNQVTDPDSLQDQVKDYLDLYVKFKLKVKEALTQKRDTNEAFLSEFGQYKKQLAEPYLLQTQLSEQLLEEAYNRLQEEVSASHILVRVPKTAAPADTLKAYDKIVEIRRAISEGADFEAVAMKQSEDPSAKQNKGYLGYFSAMQMVYPFETQAYNTPVGQVSDPFRTDFGYHLVLVKDRRPARGKMLAAHILLRFNQAGDNEEEVMAKANSVYENLQNGADWDEQCKLYSEDPNNNTRGGKLRWFGTGNLVPTFEDAAFALGDIGDISKPTRTRFGYHIIKKLDEKGLESFDQMKPQLEKQLAKDSRTRQKQSVAIAKLKKMNAFDLSLENQAKAFEAIDSTVLNAQWKSPKTSDLASLTLFTIGNSQSTVRDFWLYVQEKQRPRGNSNLSNHIQYLYNQFEESRIFDYEMVLLEENNYEYKMLLDEYRSGILLFELMEEEVWNRALKDSVGLANYYQSNVKDYQIGEHAIVKQYVYKDKSIEKQLLEVLDKSKSELDSLFNSEEPLNLQVFDKTIVKGDDKFLDANWKEGQHFNDSDEYRYLYDVKEVKTSGVSALNSIRGKVMSDYQNELERLWVAELKKKYPVKIYKPVLKSVIKSFEE